MKQKSEAPNKKIRPTAPELAELLRQQKVKALAGDTAAALALSNLLLAEKLGKLERTVLL